MWSQRLTHAAEPRTDLECPYPAPRLNRTLEQCLPHDEIAGAKELVQVRRVVSDRGIDVKGSVLPCAIIPVTAHTPRYAVAAIDSALHT